MKKISLSNVNCNICAAAFFHKRHLNRQIESVHKGRKSFKCNDCNLSFSQKGNSCKGAFTNYVYKRRGVGGQKD